MFRHALLTALRNLRRHRLTTVVNLLCLALGLACLVLCHAVVSYLAHSDAYFAAPSRIRVISTDLHAPGIGLTLRAYPYTGAVVARFLRVDLPQLAAVARAEDAGELPVSVAGRGRQLYATYARVTFADPALLDVFDFTLIAGVGSGAHPRSRGRMLTGRGVVLTEEAARRLFATNDARSVVGRTLRLAGEEDLTVAGVIADPRAPTSFHFDLLASTDEQDRLLAARGDSIDWSGATFRDWWPSGAPNITYVLLPADGSITPARLQRALGAFADRHVRGRNPEIDLAFGSIPVTGLELKTIESELAAFAHLDIPVVAIGYALAGLVLLIACLNYANLAAALASHRSREIGLRKVLGAGRRHLIAQHLFDAGLMGTAALILALAAVGLMLPLLRRSGLELDPAMFWQPTFIGYLVLLVACAAILGGLYPALRLASVHPAQSLASGPSRGERRLGATILVVAQFAASSFLLILVLVMHTQNDHLRDTARSLADSPVVTFLNGIDTKRSSLDTLRQTLASSANVESVSASGAPLISLVGSPLALTRSPQSGAVRITVAQDFVSYDFFRTLGMRLLAGRDFARDRSDAPENTSGNVPRERTAGRADRQVGRIVLDARAAAQLGWSDPRAAVGHLVYVARTGGGYWGNPLEVIGIVEPRPLNVLGVGGTAIAYSLLPSPSPLVYPTVRLSSAHVRQGLRDLDAAWKSLYPDIALRTAFVDEQFEQTYRPMVLTTALIGALTLFGLVVAALGMLAMAVHITQSRLHEIGVRKSLGAHAHHVVVLLLRDFSVPVLIAAVAVWPLAWLAGRVYLSLFVDRAPLTLLPFVVGLAISLIVAWVAVLGRALQASRVEPAAVLRYE